MKLELKILLNMGILFIGLLVNATVADYNTSDAQSHRGLGGAGRPVRDGGTPLRTRPVARPNRQTNPIHQLYQTHIQWI